MSLSALMGMSPATLLARTYHDPQDAANALVKAEHSGAAIMVALMSTFNLDRKQALAYLDKAEGL